MSRTTLALRYAAFAALARRDRLPDVIAGIDAIRATGIGPVKINAVLVPETLSGAVDLLRWCIDRGLQLRFIEAMPLDAEETWRPDTLVTAADLLAELGRHVALTPLGRDDPGAPAELWRVDDGPATVGRRARADLVPVPFVPFRPLVCRRYRENSMS